MRSRGLIAVLAIIMAALATGALFLYVQDLRSDAKSGAAQVEVVVAKEDIPAGTRLDSLVSGGAFTTQSFDEDAVIQGAVTALGDLQGRTTSVPIVAGEQITSARLQGSEALAGGVLGIPNGYEAVTLSLEPQRIVGRDLQRGDRVTLYATLRPQQADPFTSTLVSGIRVLKVSTPQTGADSTESLVTMALKPRDAQRLVFSKEEGLIFLALLPPGQKTSQNPPVSYAEIQR